MTFPPTIPSGWYPEGAALRWWDGVQWGPYAPAGPQPPPQSEEERGKTMATVSHLGFVAGGFILPLVLYLVERGKPDRNRFVCHHACEALNFAITVMITLFVPFAVLIVSLPFTVSDNSSFPVFFIAVWCLMVVTILSTYVFGILAMVRTSQGVWWRYPVSIRLVGRGTDWQQSGPVLAGDDQTGPGMSRSVNG